MNGYVKNKTSAWRHAMKRAVGPGDKIELNELYKQYGEKHNIEKGTPFVAWLQQVKLRDSTVWEVVYNEDNGIVDDNEVVIVKEMSPPPMVKKEIGVQEIVDLSVRQARERLPKISDLDLLKYAFSQANQLANKDTLCKMLRKRIRELEITRRV